MFFEPFSNKRPSDFSFMQVYFLQAYILNALQRHAKRLRSETEHRMKEVVDYTLEIARWNGEAQDDLQNINDRKLIERYVEQEKDVIEEYLNQAEETVSGRVTAPVLSPYFEVNMQSSEFIEMAEMLAAREKKGGTGEINGD